MTKENIFEIWAPEGSPWSRWVKPLAFAHTDLTADQASVMEIPEITYWAPSSTEKLALVLDLPGVEGVLIAIALAARGYRPVPLYNAMPLPLETSGADGKITVVDVLPILIALRFGAGKLASLNLPPDSPPAFLLDAKRHGDERSMAVGEFDNRSRSFATDFPSASFLAAHGIQRVRLIQKDRMNPQPHLVQSLRSWQEGGVKLERQRLDSPSAPELFEVTRLDLFNVKLAQIGERLLSRIGFGGESWLPESAAGG